MAHSKLFTPKLYTKRGTALSSADGGCFVNPPAHTKVERFNAPTDNGEAPYPLRMTQDSGQFTGAPGKRVVKTVQKIERDE